jgi:hypothetical protein
MTQLEWQQLEAAVANMTDEEKQKLASLLAPTLVKGSPSPSFGLFADEPELIDEIMAGVYHDRENQPLRSQD